MAFVKKRNYDGSRPYDTLYKSEVDERRGGVINFVKHQDYRITGVLADSFVGRCTPVAFAWI